MNRFRIDKALIAALFGLACAPGVSADGGANPVLGERVSLRAGAFLLQADAEKARFYETPRIPDEPPIDLDLLGLERRDVSPWADLRWRFHPRWHLGLSYFRFRQEGRRAALLPWPDDRRLRPTLGRLDSTIGLDLYTLGLGYSLIRTDDLDLSLRLGVHVADLLWRVDGVLLDGDGLTRSRDNSSELAPLPDVQLAVDYAIRPDLLVRLSGGWFSMEYEEYDGRLLSGSVDLEYRPTRHFGVGAGYRVLSVDLDVESGRSAVDRYNVDFQGPVVYLTTGF